MTTTYATRRRSWRDGAPSEKALNYLYTLATERVAPALGSDADGRVEYIRGHVDSGITAGDVSDAIDWLKRQPKDVDPADDRPQTVIEEDGMYVLDSDIYKVQRAVHGSGNLYAKRLVASTHCLECGVDVERHLEGWLYDHEVGDQMCPGSGTHPKVDVTFEYAPGIVRKLTADDKLTKEQAQAFGALYGTCCRCGRTLTAEDSVDRMMGPVCYGKMGW